MATTITPTSFPQTGKEKEKVPQKLFKGRDRRMLQNLIGVMDQIGRRDGKVSLAYDELDPRSQTFLGGAGLAAVTAAVNKVRARAVTLLAKEV